MQNKIDFFFNFLERYMLHTIIYEKLSDKGTTLIAFLLNSSHNNENG
jgi:hypothetical protein